MQNFLEGKGRYLKRMTVIQSFRGRVCVSFLSFSCEESRKRFLSNARRPCKVPTCSWSAPTAIRGLSVSSLPRGLCPLVPCFKSLHSMKRDHLFSTWAREWQENPMTIPAERPPGTGSTFCYLKMLPIVRETKMCCIKFTSKTEQAPAGLS